LLSQPDTSLLLPVPTFVNTGPLVTALFVFAPTVRPVTPAGLYNKASTLALVASSGSDLPLAYVTNPTFPEPSVINYKGKNLQKQHQMG